MRVLVVVLLLALAGCSDEKAPPGEDDRASVATSATVIPADADGVLQSVDARAGTAVITDWDGVDHIVPDAGLEDATFVTYDGHVARPVDLTTSDSAGKVETLDGTTDAMPATGVVKWFNGAYGFITLDQGGEVFFHFADVQAEGNRLPSEGRRVVCDVVRGPKGPQAWNIQVLSS